MIDCPLASSAVCNKMACVFEALQRNSVTTASDAQGGRSKREPDCMAMGGRSGLASFPTATELV